MKRLCLILAVLFLLPTILVAKDRVTGQILTATDGATLITAPTNRCINVKAVSIIATSGTSVNFNFYNGDNYVLGDADDLLTVDKDGGDGPAGIVIPYCPAGWYKTNANGEDLKIYLSAAVKVTVTIVWEPIEDDITTD